MLRYRDNMTTEETRKFMEEINRLDACMADAQQEAEASQDVCAECGEPLMQDPTGSPGVLVHGVEGKQDHDQDADRVPYREEEGDQGEILRRAALDCHGQP